MNTSEDVFVVVVAGFKRTTGTPGRTGLAVAKAIPSCHITPGAGVSRSPQHHLAAINAGLIELINGREHVITTSICGHCRLMPGARLPAAMEVVGHHVVEIDVRIDSLQVEVGQLVGTASGGDGDFVALAIALLQPIELLAQQLQGGLKVGPVINADGITSCSTTAGVFPVEINGGDEAVLLQRVDHIAGEGLPASGIVQRQAEFIREGPPPQC